MWSIAISLHLDSEYNSINYYCGVFYMIDINNKSIVWELSL